MKNGMCAAMQHQDVASRVNSNTGHLNEIPGCRCSGGGARWKRPVRLQAVIPLGQKLRWYQQYEVCDYAPDKN